MDRPYDDIPRQGKHLGEDVHEEPTTNVRSQKAVSPGEAGKKKKRSAAESAKDVDSTAESAEDADSNP